MRDPDRIPNVLQKVVKLWRMYPEWRLGQLIANVAAWRDAPVWEIEEEELTAEIERHLKPAEQTSKS